MLEFKVITESDFHCSGQIAATAAHCLEACLNRQARDGWRIAYVMHGGAIDRLSCVVLQRSTPGDAPPVPAEEIIAQRVAYLLNQETPAQDAASPEQPASSGGFFSWLRERFRPKG